MKNVSEANARRILYAMALVYFAIVAIFLVFGEQCYNLLRADDCYHPCEHGCELALGLLKHGAFVSIDQPGQLLTDWPPGYAFFVLPFLWAGDGHSLLGAVVFQTALVFVVGLILRRAVDAHLPGYGLLFMGFFVFNPNIVAMALMPKTDTLFALCLTVAFISLLDYVRDHMGRRVALAGVLVGISVMVRPSSQFLVVLFPVVIVLMAWVGSEKIGIFRAFLHGLGGTALAAGIVLPWIMYVGAQGEGYRLTAPATEYVFWSDNIGLMEAYLAGQPMTQRKMLHIKFEKQLSKTIPNWRTLSKADKDHARVALARDHLLSYELSDYIYPIVRSFVRFLVTGGDGYLMTLSGIRLHEQFGAEVNKPTEGHPAAIIAINIVAKGYTIISRLLGILGIIWLLRQRQFSVLILCMSPILYFLFLHMLEGWSRFRMPVEAPLALLAVFGLALLLNWWRPNKQDTPTPA